MPKLLFTSGVHLGPFIFEYFPGTKLAQYVYTCTIYVYTQKYHISAKRTITKCFDSKWWPKNEFSFLEKKKSRDQKLKNHFSKGIFKQNLAQSWRTWINLHFKSKIWKKKELSVLFKNGSQNKFCDIGHYCPFMLISVKMAWRISIFFFTKRCITVS